MLRVDRPVGLIRYTSERELAGGATRRLRPRTLLYLLVLASVGIYAMFAAMAAANPAGRLGQPDEFGAACAFLCSAHAGFITGQNLLMDGGAFPGTL